MDLFMRFFRKFTKYGLEYFGKFYSEYDGSCVDNQDPDEQGRIIVKVPCVAGNSPIGAWAWPKPAWAGKNSGTFIVPDVGDPVTVTFMNGNPSMPRYTGGAWPKPAGKDNFTPTGMYVNKVPVVRAFRTKAGHELSFCDDPENLGVKFIWHDPGKDIYTFFAITKDGSVQVANHKGAVLEMRAADDDADLNMIIDSRGNSIIQDKDGIKVIDKNGNAIELKDGIVQVTGNGDVVITSDNVNVKTGSVVLGDGSKQPSVRGKAWFDWFNNTFLKHYMAHVHPTGVGPSGPMAPPPLVPPIEQDILTQNVKVP